MHILHVITHLGLGGAERVAETIAMGMVGRGIASTVFAIAASDDTAMAGGVTENLERHGIDVIATSTRRNRKSASVGAALDLRRVVARLRPDIVHIHTEIPEFAWALTTLTSRSARATPVVRTIHNSVLWPGWCLAGRIAEACLRDAQVVAVSEAALKAHASWRGGEGRTGPPSVVIYNGIEPVPLAPRSLRPPPLRLLFAGRFEPQKGIDILLHALRLLDLGPDRLHVEIVGSGGMAADVERAVAADPGRLSLSSPRVNLRKHLAEYDAVLLPSRFEGLPILAIEAMCAGVPVLATAVPGLDEALPPGYPGRCVPEPEAVAALIQQFVDAPEVFRQAATDAQPWADRRYAVDRMIDAYEAVYRAVGPSEVESGPASAPATGGAPRR